ncbi:MAG: ABC transporter permease [Chloroflexota bacterium]
MSFRHLLAVTRKEMNHIVRDPYTLVLVLLSPTILLLVFAYALTVDISHVPVAILDQDRTQTSQAFVQQIMAGDDLDLYGYVDSIDEIEDLLARSKVKAVVTIGPGFSDNLYALKGISLQINIDGTEPESGGYAVEHISLRATEFVDDLLADQIRAIGIDFESFDPIDLRVRAWFNPSLKPRNDLIPGLISMVLGIPAMLVALTIAHEREHGTLEQLLVTPIKRTELLVGKMIPYLLVGLVNVIFIPALARVLFKVPFNGNFVLFFILSAVFMAAILSMGIVLGVFMKTQSAALALSFLMIFFPGFFLTGIFFPIVSMPDIMRMESLFMPGTHYAIITRGVFLNGVGLEVLWPYTVFLAILAFSFTAIAAIFFKKRLA